MTVVWWSLSGSQRPKPTMAMSSFCGRVPRCLPTAATRLCPTHLGRPASGPAWPVVFGVMACTLLLGIGQAFIVVPSQTLLQERSGEEVRARVLSTFFTLSNASALVPTLTAGLIGDTIGVQAGILALAIGALALGIWSTTISGRGDRRAIGGGEGR